MGSRIELTDNMATAITKIVEGNPGALRVCCELVENVQTIDPNHFAGPFAPILLLDSFDLYGSEVWMLYKDVCNYQVDWTYGMLRALQFGIVNRYDLVKAFDREISLDVPDIMRQVQEQLPEFALIAEGQ